VGPIQVEMHLEKCPGKVSLALEKGKVQWSFRAGPKAAKGAGKLTARIDQGHIDAALVVET
jgi:hypothetical protein